MAVLKKIAVYDIFRIGGSVLDVKKWIESGAPVHVIMSTLHSVMSGNSSATDIQKLIAGGLSLEYR